ncbi:hypothetical protein [Cellulomonas sp. Leaf334]|uniref:hypothetical protein n=1 Tax=Cellulomonas sp. Leaf334 TaxID=1736339 RepID=UPI000AB2AC29|nr:hypothetical protein [Cellulomonas sp. Leaf334]
MGTPVMWCKSSSTDQGRTRELCTSLFGRTADAPPRRGGYALLDTGSRLEAVSAGIGAADPDGLWA